MVAPTRLKPTAEPEARLAAVFIGRALIYAGSRLVEPVVERAAVLLWRVCHYRGGYAGGAPLWWRCSETTDCAYPVSAGFL